MATCIHSSQSCLPPFYTIPIFPLLKSISFFIYLSPFIFCCTLHIKFYALRNILPGAIIVVYTLVVFISCCRNCVMYVHQLSAVQLLIWASYRHLLKRDYLRLFVVVYKLVMLMLWCW